MAKAMKPIVPNEELVELTFPMRGIDRSSAYQKQPKGTTPIAINVRAFSPDADRARGGMRGGLERYIDALVASTSNIQMIDHFVSTIDNVDQTYLSVRRIKGITVAGGNVRTFYQGAYATPTNGDTALEDGVDVVFGQQMGVNYFFADGVSQKYYVIATDTVGAWAASSGTLPVGSATDYPRLICLWRNRLVLSGVRTDAHNWFMSAVNDAFNWDYALATTLATQAAAGNLSPAGLVGDKVTCLIPFSDDILIFGCDSSIWKMQGDPMAGGSIDRISDSIGMAWGRPWCKGPDGTLYFFASRGGVWAMTPDSQPVRISQQITHLLRSVDLNENIIRMAWDDREQGIHVYVTPLVSTVAATHYFWDSRMHAWFQTKFGNKNHNPKAIHTFDGDDPDDRVVLIGSWDGYIRKYGDSAVHDDRTDIESEVWLGPMVSSGLDRILLKDALINLTEGSGDINWSIHTGNTAEAAVDSEAIESGTLVAGRNPNVPMRVSGHAMFLKLSSTNRWAMDAIRVRLSGLGKVQRRNQ